MRHRAPRDGVPMTPRYRQHAAPRPDSPAHELHRLELLSTGVAETLINAMEAKNAYLRGHSQRVAEVAASVAETLGLPAGMVEQVRLAGRLHDVGKIGIREAVLDKPGPLEPAEYAHVKDHVRIGLEILAPLTYLGPVLDFIADHHERPDGSGYPRGLAGEAISLGGRIVAAADVFDALTSRRAYRDPRTEQDTLAYMQGMVGTALFADVFEALRHAVERRRSLVFLGDMRAPAHLLEHCAAGAPADVHELVAAIAELPAAERLALTLHYLEGLSDAEIASLVDGDAASVLQLRRIALRRIAKAG
ncbi:MAG TPA: HD domain-containing phosphohydrolase [Solirubrobacter sp.]|jgi:putative nucleotidyltransferase with HDIG domain|nr:HD domain-containing phosphohydrolase [Solirubrobacter sp.]